MLNGTCPSNQFCYVTVATAPMGTGECRGGPCDVVTQNCTAANSQCNYGADGGRDCYPDGTLNEGDLCGPTISAACKKSTTCVSGIGLADGGIGSACAKYCRTGADCLGGKLCNVAVTIMGTDERPLICNLPPPSCTLLLQNCANTAQGCYLVSQTSTGCLTPGTTANAAACTTQNQCLKGSACIGSAGNAFCRQVCNTDGGMPSCTAGACQALSFGMGVGACL